MVRNREFWTVHRHRFGAPEKFFRGGIIQGKWRNIYRPCAQPCSQALSALSPERGCHHAMSFASSRRSVSRLPRVQECFLVEFDLLFAFDVLSYRILGSASLIISYVHEHDRLGFGMLTVERETAVFDCRFVDLI